MININSALKIVEIVCPIISVIVAYFLLKESRKMYNISTSPNLVFSFNSLSSHSIYGRLENIGNGTAYNIKVKITPDFEILRSKSINQVFNSLTYLAPKQCYDVNYGSININHKLIGFKAHKLQVSWTNKIKSKKMYHFEADFDESYFDSFPTSNTFNDLVKEVKNLNRNLKSKKL